MTALLQIKASGLEVEKMGSFNLGSLGRLRDQAKGAKFCAELALRLKRRTKHARAVGAVGDKSIYGAIGTQAQPPSPPPPLF